MNLHEHKDNYRGGANMENTNLTEKVTDSTRCQRN